MKLCRLLVMTLLCFAAAISASAQSIVDGKTLLAAMHAHYEKNWYQTMTFKQKSTTYNVDGTTKVETWYEAAILPGKLRIDFGTPSAGNGAIMADGKGYFFERGKRTKVLPYVNLLLVLGFDVYQQAPDATLAELKGEGIDLAKFHEEEWQGEPVYVVGAEKGDLKSRQFWIEKKRLLFLRLIQPNRRDEKKIDDIRFADYRELPKGYIAARVEVYEGERLDFSEEYSEIQTGVNLDPRVFDPAQFSLAHWEK